MPRHACGLLLAAMVLLVALAPPALAHTYATVVDAGSERCYIFEDQHGSYGHERLSFWIEVNNDLSTGTTAEGVVIVSGFLFGDAETAFNQATGMGDKSGLQAYKASSYDPSMVGPGLPYDEKVTEQDWVTRCT